MSINGIKFFAKDEKKLNIFSFVCIDMEANACGGSTRLAKAWTAIDKLSIIWRSDLTDKMNRSFFQTAVVSILLYESTTWTITKGCRRT